MTPAATRNREKPRDASIRSNVPPSVAPPDAVREAAHRVGVRWADSTGDASHAGEAHELLDAIVVALTRPGDVPARLRSNLGRRVLELLRAELIAIWTGSADPPEISQILDTLAALERLRTTIEPDWDKYLESRLSGPDGLELVVEVAHDLRSPLTSILFLAETIQRGQSGDVNELQRRQLGLVYSAALGLSTVASNVIEMARGGNRLAEEESSPFSVTDILQSVSDIVHPMAEEKGLAVRLFPPVSDYRLGHPHALSRVLLNLTTNALKFTEEGFVEIVARESDLATVEFSVRDTGPGINPQALETLYVPFRRSGTGDGYAFSGTGLGLALSRKLVEAMGSELRVETRPDWGTRFHFELALPSPETP